MNKYSWYGETDWPVLCSGSHAECVHTRLTLSCSTCVVLLRNVDSFVFAYILH